MVIHTGNSTFTPSKVTQVSTKLQFPAESHDDLKQTEAELQMAVLTASSNVPLAFHDHLSPTIKKVFPDSKIASKNHSASTKATSMLNEAVAPAARIYSVNRKLSELLKCPNPWSMCTSVGVDNTSVNIGIRFD